MKKILPIILMLFLLAACETPATQFPSPTETIVHTSPETPVPHPVLTSALLLKITMTGGLCPYGGCHVELILDSEGGFTLKEGVAQTQQGDIDQARFSKLTEYIDTANFNKIRSHSFTDICPTAYDGQEMTYTFYTSQGVETISSCEVVIDDQDPLFQLTNAVWQEIFSKR
ncbi:MAG: hypothetical protein FD147_2180 [Chloroflexi bacterium]|nr:MAG: hypothetical protein FD147_2180 [Chloroflexota bacterium]